MIYLASPYSHPDPAIRKLRFRAACKAAAALIRAGATVYSPIVHSHPLEAYGLPTDWKFWERIDREHLARCDDVVVLKLAGWDRSIGVQAEIAIARERHMPIRFAEPGELCLARDWPEVEVPQ